MTDPASTPSDEVEPEPAAPPPDLNLFRGGLVLIALTLGYYSFNAEVSSSTAFYEGLAIIFLAALPALMWAKRATHGFPVFEVFMLTGANIYALPLLNGQSNLEAFSESVVTQAGAAVLLFQIIANVTYAATSGRPRTTKFWTEEVISDDTGRYLGYGLVLTTIYTGIANFSDLIPNDLESPLRAVFYGIGIIISFIQGLRWGQGTLNYQEKVMLVLNITLQVIFNFATLYLLGGMSIIVLVLIGYVSGSKRLPIVIIVITLPIIALLHNGKTTMREKYWNNENTDIASMPSLAELPAFYTEWIQDGLDLHQKSSLTEKLIERTSLFQIICLVVDNTPDRRPYLDGLTYGQIPGQFVPRFFWANKPVGKISTDTLSVYYGLQRAEDTQKTTIAFGLLAEAYANFGFFGVGLLGAVFAFGLKKYSMWASQSPMLSYAGLILVLIMAWSFQSELTLSTWLSSLFQAVIAVLGVPFVLRNFLG
ncbi:MAG TPA: hypothetical protein VNV15_04890 [Opitutaceae bacterium]|jgi:hypothetical protein|nr:hypothetical protein [Opitutaceae bacterium]